ncbi:MAG: hypothetical protein V7K49_28210 [Nostoc sp.]
MEIVQSLLTKMGIFRKPQQAFEQLVSQSVNQITDKRWREIFLLTVGILEEADDLLQLMKQRIDKLLAGDEKLQEFLTLINEKSCSVETPYKPVAVRAFYLSLSLELKRSLQQLKDQLPDPSADEKKSFKNWWQKNGQAWAKELRSVMIKHRNIGHHWQFNDDQKQLLK